jgi:hypothetical protein
MRHLMVVGSASGTNGNRLSMKTMMNSLALSQSKGPFLALISHCARRIALKTSRYRKRRPHLKITGPRVKRQTSKRIMLDRRSAET